MISRGEGGFMESLKFTVDILYQLGRLLSQLIVMAEPILKIASVGCLYFFVMTTIIYTTRQSLFKSMCIVTGFIICLCVCLNIYLNMWLSIIILCRIGIRMIQSDLDARRLFINSEPKKEV